jgi:uncharacterized protein (DUF1697 family)
MNTYVAFIRGINVGGNNIIKMDRLKELCAGIGWQSVITYIQSGNVVFQSEINDKKLITSALEKMFQAEMQKEIKVVVLNLNEMKQIVDHLPTNIDDPLWKHNVIFLRPSLDTPDVISRFPIKNEIESITYFKGVLYWSARQDALTRSVMIKLSTRKEYQEMTVRNVNTTRKILDIMKELQLMH